MLQSSFATSQNFNHFLCIACICLFKCRIRSFLLHRIWGGAYNSLNVHSFFCSSFTKRRQLGPTNIEFPAQGTLPMKAIGKHPRFAPPPSPNLLANTDIPELRSAIHSLRVSHTRHDSTLKKQTDINKVWCGGNSSLARLWTYSEVGGDEDGEMMTEKRSSKHSVWEAVFLSGKYISLSLCSFILFSLCSTAFLMSFTV